MSNSLNDKQIAFWIFSAIVGDGIIRLPRDIAEAAGTASWLSIAISTIPFVISIYLYIRIAYSFKNHSFYEYSNVLVGKVTTFIFLIIFVPYCFLIAGSVLRASCEMLKANFYPKAPVFFISSLIMVTAYYIIIKGQRPIARINVIYGVIIMFSILLISANVLFKGDMVNLKPWMGTGDYLTIMKSLPVCIFSFLGTETLAVITMGKDNKKRVLWYSIGIMLFISFLYMLIVESIIALMSVNDIVNYRWVVLAAIRKIEIPLLQFLKRIDGIFLISWLMAVFTTVVVYSYTAIKLLSDWLKININIIATAVILLFSIFSFIPGSFEDMLLFTNYLSYVGIIPVIVIPLILFVALKVKKYDVKAKK